MNKKDLENQLKILVLDTGTLNEFRQKVFASYNAGLITDKTKRQLLIELYDKADHQSIFYMRITDKKQMPIEESKQEEDEETSYSESESYSQEEQYS